MRRHSEPPGDEDHGVPAGAGGAIAGQGASGHESQDSEAVDAGAWWPQHHPGKKGNFEIFLL